MNDTLVRGAAAPDFRLPGTDGRDWSLAECAGANGVLVMFICNHCPYVKGAIQRIVHEAQALRAIGVGSVAISANDATAYPEDGFERMREFAAAHRFGFPYLYDEPQAVARAYGAVCTPDYFGFDREGRLRYRGRLDSSGRGPAGPDTKRELYEAMRQVVDTGSAPEPQQASIGCSIKWKA